MLATSQVTPVRKLKGWTIAYWALMGCFLLAAALNLLHVRGGFLTSYLADLTVPASLYVISRGLAPGGLAPGTKNPFFPLRWLMSWLGRTPERAAIFFFAASAATEWSQIYWPRGFFAGTFDPWDIVAYGAGILICYACDKMQGRKNPDART